MNDQVHSRRTVLRIGAGAGAAAIGAWALSATDAARAVTQSASVRAAAATSTGCATLTKEETQGPFWVDERLKRSDIRSDTEGDDAIQAGVPLTFTLTVMDADGCTPQAGAYVDVWHANADGHYSDVSGAGNPDETGHNWLRGYQVTDSKGQVTFRTIYPGWYAGRTVHIHYRIRTSLSSTSSVNFTSQLFFADSLSNTVFTSSSYPAGTRTTTNANDSLYDAALVMPLTGSNAAGYTGAFQVNLDFGDGAGGTGGAGGSVDSTVRASLLAASVVRRSRGRRVLEVHTRNTEIVTALVRLARHDDVLAHHRFGWWSRGVRRRTVVVPRSVVHGRAKAVVRFTDKAGNTKVASLPVTVPRT